MNKREIVAIFRKRLFESMQERGVNQSQLSRETGVDRSTLSQLLSPDNDRLPRVEGTAGDHLHEAMNETSTELVDIGVGEGAVKG